MKLRPGLAAFGTSIRCNDEGARQLREVLARIGWELIVVPLPGYTIHIDLHLAMVDDGKALDRRAGPAVRASSSGCAREGIETIYRRPVRGVGR